MQHELYKFLYDIQCSIESIEDFLGNNRDFNVYQTNKQLRRAVERELEIIGEAMSCVLKIDNSISIQNPRKIVDLRNFVIHNYDKVDDIIIWGILINHLPILKEDINKLMNPY